MPSFIYFSVDLKKLPDLRKQNKISRQTLSCVEEAKLLGGEFFVFQNILVAKSQ